MDASHIEALLLTLTHIVLALTVTGHVLLNKRDVGATIGWIGLVWLSPFIGSILYLMLGINRVTRRARRLRRPRARGLKPQAEISIDPELAHLEPLWIAAGRLSGRQIKGGTGLEILALGDNAYPRMVASIKAAKISVALSSYIFRADEAGNQFIEALSDAVARGVAVRVLIDGIGAGYFISPTYTKLCKAGVPVARFLHSNKPWRMPFLNMRTHKKILVVDGAIAFTGGLNIGAENVQATNPPHPVRDTHFELRGPVVTELTAAFAEDWSFTTGEDLTAAEQRKIWFPQVPPVKGGAPARVITSGPDHDLDKLESVILSAIAVAHRSVRVVTPYFLPDERMLSALTLAATRGVLVDIVIPEQGNHRLVDWAARAQLMPLMQAGCHIWYSRPPFDHSKLMTVDGGWSMIGSANWDMRSLRLNFEMNVEIYSSPFATELNAVIDSKLHRRMTMEALTARPLPIVLRDAAARLLLPYL